MANTTINDLAVGTPTDDGQFVFNEGGVDQKVTKENLLGQYASIEDLPPVVIGNKVNATGYQPGSIVGGGDFVGKPDIHNGITAIDPTRTYPTPAEWGAGPSDPAVIAWYATTGGTVDCWVRVENSSYSPYDAGAFGDGSTDDTASFLAMAKSGSGVTVVREQVGEFVISSVSLTKSMIFDFSKDVKLIRKSGTDLAQGSWWISGAAMFEVDAAGLSLRFANFTYDGNNINQTTVEPTGFFLKTYPISPYSLDTNIEIDNGEFFNGTSGYLVFRGDDVNQRYETYAKVENCKFHATIYGKGKGDPSTPNPLGYNPTYIWVLDYVRLDTYNFEGDFDKTTGVGEYAACGINGTFFGAVYANSGESHIHLHGTTKIKNLGRSAKKYDGTPDYVTNNGIGAIDMYGNAHTLYVENLVANDTQNVPCRAKGSLKNYVVLSATLTNCWRGLQVSPSTTGTPETVVYIGNLSSFDGTIPQLEVVGNNSSELIRSCYVGNASCYGTYTNPESLPNEGNIRFRNLGRLDLDTAFANGSPTRGFEAIDVTRLNIESVTINSTAQEGMYLQGGKILRVGAFDIKSAGSSGITIAATPTKVTLNDGFIDGAVNYGIFSNTATELNVTNCHGDNVSGLDRFIYANGGTANIKENNSGNIATSLIATTATRLNEDSNSWNPIIFYASSIPVSGTYNRGDRALNSLPSAGGKAGWICTASGTPGTWKPFSAIDA